MRNTATATASAALFLLLLASPAVSQPAPTTSPPTINNIFEHQPRAHVRFPSLEIVLIVIIACLYISFQYCSKASAAIGASVRRGLSIRSRGPAESRGLDAPVIESFPTFSYSAARDHFRFGNECSVCLSEFEDGETIRLVPTCDHVFHPECIDAWLACHVTCPVCRADLSRRPLRLLCRWMMALSDARISR